MKIKIRPLLGAYIALGTIEGLNYIAFGDTHTKAMQELFIKHQLNTQ